ncbi:GFA family protein [Magnetospira sp. QH-2]|uniref:GFA family protein n=1 Tax=Magnetospira sp. (strain QH-2) TaxID=1288970 RepID=UPI0003E81690|nr:GFA family protein [Magnetospira sp. QH-2]CCQ73595.1 Conserved protein of unknown function. Containing glutathione-dependent formaldehyde-activating, GFA [Magnetospira sp. QH-2]
MIAQPISVFGSCLCGAVRYAVTKTFGVFQNCHCSRCRKVSGAMFASNLLVPPDGFRWLAGADLVGRYEPEESKHFATAFCRVCGSSMPWLGKSGKAVVVPAGTMDKDPGLRPTQNIFCASRADWHTDPGTLPHFDELPPRR